jgi:hypothetical protein
MGNSQRSGTRAYLPDIGLAAILGVAAYLLTIAAGQRGFYAFDQSILFDGGYRVLTGQVPYRDFVLPFGPVALWLQALFFAVSEVTYSAYIASAAIVNAAAAIAAVVILRMLFPSTRLLPYLAGALTAFWFYPPFGTPWVDQTAFFFSLLAIGFLLAGVLDGGPRKGSRSGLFLAMSGGLAFLAFMSKQNVGAFMVALYPALLVAVFVHDGKRLGRALLVFCAGLAVSVLAFAIWLRLRSDPAIFSRYVLEIPSALGRERITWFVKSWFGLRTPFFGGRGPVIMILMTWGSLAFAVWRLVSTWHAKRGAEMADRRLLAANALCIYLVAFQHAFTNTTLNQPENGLVFAGMIFGIAACQVPAFLSRLRPAYRAAAVAVGLLVAGMASAQGFDIAMSRKVHDIFRGSEYGAFMHIPGLERLRWARPTRMGGFEIGEQDVENLYLYLSEQRKNFFVFPDFTIMYGLVAARPPQPLLWFHDGVTYSSENNEDLDKWIVEDLERNNVEIFVIELVSWFNTGERLRHFPRLETYLRTSFRKAGQIGPFSIYYRGDR